MFDKRQFSLRMSQRRKDLNLTLQSLAECIGVDRRSLSSWENPDNPAMPRNFYHLIRWCESLGITVQESLSNRIVDDRDLVRDPYHRSQMRSHYIEYMTDKVYAQLMHRIAALSKRQRKAALSFCKSMENSDMAAALRMDAEWDRLQLPPDRRGQ